METYIIRGLELVFLVEEGGYHVEKLDVAYVLKHGELNERILRIPSILGRDVLNRYKLILSRGRGMGC